MLRRLRSNQVWDDVWHTPAARYTATFSLPLRATFTRLRSSYWHLRGCSAFTFHAFWFAGVSSSRYATPACPCSSLLPDAVCCACLHCTRTPPLPMFPLPHLQVHHTAHPTYLLIYSTDAGFLFTTAIRVRTRDSTTLSLLYISFLLPLSYTHCLYLLASSHLSLLSHSLCSISSCI